MRQVVNGEGGLSKVALRSHDGATADVYLLGAHVTSWRPSTDGAERLFLSARSEFRDGAAIRGGIPVIFPQFAAEGPLPRHGFARNMSWTLAEVSSATSDDAVAIFLLRDSDATRAVWASSFRATLTVRVGGDQLLVALAVENAGTDPLRFTAALHTYFRVDHALAPEVIGLHGCRYRESGTRDRFAFETEEAIAVSAEIDRVYVDATSPVTIREATREMIVEREGFPDVVVWNPGATRAAALPDMEPGGERRMLCVEAAAVQSPIVLEGGRRWSASQRLTARSRDM